VPTHAETGYGYIKAQKQVGKAYSVDCFVEKTDANTAIEHVKSDDYFWNSGVFCFKADVYLQELEKFQPDILAACKEAFSASQKDCDCIRLGVSILKVSDKP
jgi:mannose-1-phosphate guanylyltransferase